MDIVTDTVAERRAAQKSQAIKDTFMSLKENKTYENFKSNDVYLINRSYTKIIPFTIKVIQDNGVIETEIHKLNPGQEFLLGCNLEIDNYGNLQKIKFR